MLFDTDHFLPGETDLIILGLPFFFGRYIRFDAVQKEVLRSR